MDTTALLETPDSEECFVSQQQFSSALGTVAVPTSKKWSRREDDLIIELRGSGMKWGDIAKRLPGRTVISCRLHYQNYLERRCPWDEERMNKLARLYERLKPEMWAKVAEELQVPWRAAEAMHWQLGEAEMAERAGTTPFSQSMSSGSERISPNHGHAHSQPQERLPGISQRVSLDSERISPNHGHAHSQPQERLPGISSLHLPPLPNQPPDYGYEPDFDCAPTYGLVLGGNPGQLGGGSFSLPMPGISSLHLPPLPNQPLDYGYEPDFDCATTYGLALGGNPGQLGGGSFSLPMPGISTPAYSNGDSSNRGRGAPPLLPSHLSAHHPHQQWGQYRGR